MKARVFILTLTTAAALMAQGPGGGFHRGGSEGAAPVDPVTRQVRGLTRFLDLTTAQQTQVTNILTADSTNLTTLQATLKTERANVVAAIKANSGVAATIATLSSTQSQVETIRANEAAQIYALLTAEQKAKVGDGLGPLYGGGPGRGFGPPPGGVQPVK